MKRLSIIIGAAIALGVLVIIFVGMYKFNFRNDDIILSPTPPVSIKDTTYVIDHRAVTLIGGIATERLADSSASMTTKYFGNEVEGDFNNDGQADTAFLLTQDSGGTGTFYYLVVALKQGSGYRGTNAILLGDRIAPQTTGYMNNLIVVNYADRKPIEPMTAIPTVGISRYFSINGTVLTEVSK